MAIHYVISHFLDSINLFSGPYSIQSNTSVSHTRHIFDGQAAEVAKDTATKPKPSGKELSTQALLEETRRWFWSLELETYPPCRSFQVSLVVAGLLHD